MNEDYLEKLNKIMDGMLETQENAKLQSAISGLINEEETGISQFKFFGSRGICLEKNGELAFFDYSQLHKINTHNLPLLMVSFRINEEIKDYYFNDSDGNILKIFRDVISHLYTVIEIK